MTPPTSIRQILSNLTDDQVDYIASLVIQAQAKRELVLRTTATLIFRGASTDEAKPLPNA